MKIGAVVIGLFVVGLAYVSYRGWVDVKWVAIEDASRSTLTNASEQVVNALNNTTTQFAAQSSAYRNLRIICKYFPLLRYRVVCLCRGGE
jgi:uncharacterized membrane protein (Fun14 family)